MSRCNYQPKDRNYAPCTRDAGHDGPCAHPLRNGMDPRTVVMYACFGICIIGVLFGCLLGLMGIWIDDFGKIGWRLFMSDIVITLSAILVSVITQNFWK